MRIDFKIITIGPLFRDWFFSLFYLCFWLLQSGHMRVKSKLRTAMIKTKPNEVRDSLIQIIHRQQTVTERISTQMNKISSSKIPFDERA